MSKTKPNMKTEIKYKNHEYADIFPLMDDYTLKGLIESIKKNGLRDDILIYENRILDGRNREKACRLVNVTPRYSKYEGSDPLQFVVDHNLHRRHLNESQRAMVGAKLATYKNGTNQHENVGRSIDRPTSTDGLSQEYASKQLNIGVSSIFRARKITDNGADELIAAVKQGDLSVYMAHQLIALPKDQQVELLKLGNEAMREKAKQLKLEAKETRAMKSNSRITEHPRRITMAPQSIGKGIAALAISQLQRINTKDTQRAESLQSVIDYCTKRISEGI